jgi:exodeoxyribonuclease VII large subunit
VAFETELDIAYDSLQSAAESKQVLTVSEVNARAKKRLESDPALRRIWVRGEVSTWTVRTKRNGNPYAFFTLCDETSQLSGVIWNGALSRLSLHPKKGETVRVLGSINVYKAHGVYQIRAEALVVENRAGALWQRYEQTKRKLEAEGLFAAERKRPLPKFPQRVGVITSLEGAVLHDIVRIARERHAGIPIVVFPASVQGEGAPASLVAALTLANSDAVEQAAGVIDVLILARGGGSIEDLWAFNDEAVVRAVANSRIPVVSAVGHETDTVLTDFAADDHAPTPSAAAQTVFPDREELRERLRQLVERSERATRLKRVRDRLAAVQMRLEQACARALDQRHKTLLGYATRLAQCSPEARLSRAREQLARVDRALTQQVAARLAAHKQRFTDLAAKLDMGSPYAVLQRGYALLRDPHTHAVLTRVAQVSAQQPIEIVLADGALRATITEVINHDDRTQ